MVKDIIVQRIRELCDERDISYTELSRRAGMTPSTIYSLLQPKRRDVSAITVKKICDGFDITLGEFFSTPEFDNLEQEIK
jgi:transcriptional regulator with XRE-family HTH domain